MLFNEVDTLCTDGLVKLTYKPYFDLNDDLYVFAKDSKFGIASYSGKILYESVFDFVNKADDYGVVIKNHEYGIIDNKGKMIADIKYKDIDYVNNCKRFILNDYSSCYLVSKEQNIIYKSSNIIHIDCDLFLCKDENIIIDADGNKVMDINNKHTYSAEEDYIIESDKKDKQKKFYNRNGKMLYQTNKDYLFLGKKEIVLFKYNGIMIYDLVNNNEIKIPKYYELVNEGTIYVELGYLILKDKKTKNKYLLSIDNGLIIPNESLSLVNVFDVTTKYIYGSGFMKEKGSLYKHFLFDYKGNIINIDYCYIKRIVDDFIIVSDENDNIGMINFNNEVILSLNKISINYIDEYFLVEEHDNYYIYDKAMNIIYSSTSKIEFVKSNDNFILISILGKKTLLDKEGNVILEHVTGDIDLRNNHIVLYDGYVIDFNQEYINLDVDYELFAGGYLFHNKTIEEREYLKKRINYETEMVISNYFKNLDIEKNKEYVKRK